MGVYCSAKGSCQQDYEWRVSCPDSCNSYSFYGLIILVVQLINSRINFEIESPKLSHVNAYVLILNFINGQRTNLKDQWEAVQDWYISIILENKLTIV